MLFCWQKLEPWSPESPSGDHNWGPRKHGERDNSLPPSALFPGLLYQVPRHIVPRSLGSWALGVTNQDGGSRFGRPSSLIALGGSIIAMLCYVTRRKARVLNLMTSPHPASTAHPEQCRRPFPAAQQRLASASWGGGHDALHLHSTRTHARLELRQPQEEDPHSRRAQDRHTARPMDGSGGGAGSHLEAIEGGDHPSFLVCLATEGKEESHLAGASPRPSSLCLGLAGPGYVDYIYFYIFPFIFISVAPVGSVAPYRGWHVRTSSLLCSRTTLSSRWPQKMGRKKTGRNVRSTDRTRRLLAGDRSGRSTC